MNRIANTLYALGAVVTAISLSTSRGFITVGIIILVLALLMRLITIHKETGIHNQLKDLFRSGITFPFLVLSLPFFLILLSGLYTTDTHNWLDDIRVTSATLAFPLIALGYGKINQHKILVLQVIFLAASLVSSIYSMTLYLIDYEALTSSLGQGHHLPTLLDALRFSLILSFGIIVALDMFIKGQVLKYPSERYAYLVLAIIFFIFQHIFAVRSGLAITYASLLFYLIYRSIESFKYYQILGFLFILVFPILAYLYIPSLNTKVNYAIYDLKQRNTEDAGQYSDSNRLLSYELAYEIIKDSPIIGHGGDSRNLIIQAYKDKYPQVEKPLQPHNQFLTMTMKTGIIGLVLFLFAIFFPLAQMRWRSNILFPIITLQIFLACMVENTLGMSIGIAHYLFWTCLFLMEWRSK